MNKHWKWVKWAIVAVVVLMLVAGVVRSLSARKAQQEAVAEAAKVKTITVLELTPHDITYAQVHELVQGLPLTGTLKAVNSATLKARVAGELQTLTVREGDSVKAGQVLARIEATEMQARLRQAQDQADAAKAQVDVALRQHDNNRALVDQGFISKTALDTSQANLNAARANHQAALAAVDVARKTLADTVLVAPISGLISQRLAQSGEHVPVDGKIVEIVDLSRIELEAAVSASDAAQVRIGQGAQLQIEGSTDVVQARVVRINPSTQAGSRNVLVYLAVTPNPALRQGLFAQGTLGTERVRTLAVPLNAIRTDQPAPYVQGVLNNQITHQPVTPGVRGVAAGTASPTAEALVAVTGLAEGAMVLNGNVGTLRPGTVVKLTAGH